MHDLTLTLKEAELWLSRNDKQLGGFIKNGSSAIANAFKKEPFEALVHAIISQQLSVKSASAIRQRVHALLPNEDASPYGFSRVSNLQLKQAGMSPAKIHTLNTVIEFALSKEKPFSILHKQSDQKVKHRLCELKGIGPWTVDIFLMFGLKRLDIFAPGDLGLRKAIQQLYGINELPSPAECDNIAQKWQPYRTVAAWHLWRTLD